MSKLILKIKSRKGQSVVKDLTTQHTTNDLKRILSELTEIADNRLNVLAGFPPKPLDLGRIRTLEIAGIKSGETLIVEESATVNVSEEVEIATEATETLCTDQPSTQPNVIPGMLLKRVVPSDNSCLFTSIGYVLKGVIDTTVGQMMREIIVQTIRNEPESYHEAILGQSPDKYCEWIVKPTAWGGAIELAILSNYFGMEIAVVDTLNAIINRFGEDKQFAHRVFLMFDGIHYDALYMELTDHNERTIFPTSDAVVYKLAEELALEAKSSRQFTDVNNFKLKCLDCNTVLIGEVEAQKHAKDTGHTNFDEVNM